ncbi:MAG: signal peptidase I [Myxococcota bacterium]
MPADSNDLNDTNDRNNHEGDGADGDGAVVNEHRFMRDTVVPILIVLAIMIPLRSAVVDWNDVPSGSMRPTILAGDRIWVNKLAYGLRWPLSMAWILRGETPRRGDIVTFASPEDGKRLVKRIIGLPGDRISMTANRLRINDKSLAYSDEELGTRNAQPKDREIPSLIETERLDQHPHAITLIPTLAGLSDSFPEWTVAENEYFVLGDNRDQSRDSRFIGTVALDDIYGRVTHVALSLDPDNSYKPRFARWGKRLDSDVRE